LLSSLSDTGSSLLILRVHQLEGQVLVGHQATRESHLNPTFPGSLETLSQWHAKFSIFPGQKLLLGGQTPICSLPTAFGLGHSGPAVGWGRGRGLPRPGQLHAKKPG
jgi:hypothetical protein